MWECVMRLIKYLLFFLILFMSLAVFCVEKTQNTKETPALASQSDKNAIEDKKEKESEKMPVEQKKEDPAKRSSNLNLSGASFNIKLRNLEEKINSLKDKVFRAKQRLSILQETVLSGAIAGARISLVQKNEVGSAFKLVSVIYYLDDAPIYKKIDDPKQLSKGEIQVFDGSVVPGPHHVSVFMAFRGNGYGLFSYMKGYKLKLNSGYSFNVEEGKILELTVMPKDKGTMEKLENRLFVSFDVHSKTYEQQTDKTEVEPSKDTVKKGEEQSEAE